MIPVLLNPSCNVMTHRYHMIMNIDGEQYMMPYKQKKKQKKKKQEGKASVSSFQIQSQPGPWLYQ